MTDTEQVAAAKKKLADEKAERETARKKLAEDMAKVKPTPTQEENDLAASGVALPEHEADGSPNEGTDPLKQQREAKPAAPSAKGSYSTRASASE